MSYDKTWQFDINRVPTSQDTVAHLSAWQMWYICEFLLGNVGGATSGKWSVYYMCDGTTAGTANDGVDRIGAGTFNSANWVQGSAISTGAKTWVVLKSPSISSKNYYMILSYYGSNTSQFSVIFSHAAPTGGSTTAAPTATDSWQACSTGNTLPYTLNSGQTLSLNHHFHGILATDGGWRIFGSRDSSTCFEFGLGFEIPMNTRSNDTVPVCSWYSYLQTGNGLPTTVGNSGSFSAGTTGSALAGRSPDNSVQAQALNAVGFMMGSTPIDLTVAGSWPAADNGDSPATWPDFPIWVITCQTNAAIGTSTKGRLADMAWANRTNGNGTMDSLTPQFMQVGCFWTPSNAIPSL